MKLKYFISAMIAAIAMMITSACVSEIEENLSDNEHLAFTASFSEEATKSAPLTRLDGDAGVIGYIYDSNSIGDISQWEELNNEKFTFDGDMLESASDGDLIKWSTIADTQKSNLRIYAYAPYNDKNISLSYSHPLQITYTSPTDISSQTDIIASTADVATSFKKNIPLTFNHILTAIKFKSGFDCTVKSITISNVNSTGTYTFGNGWGTQGTPTTYTVSFPDGKKVKAGEMITDDAAGDVLFMIPQSFGTSSTASITLTYDNDLTITTSLQDIRWEEGRMVTYTLYKKDTHESEYIYFDLAAGNVKLNNSTYSGSIYVNGEIKPVTGVHSDDNRYYVYQSSTNPEYSKFSKSNTGYATDDDFAGRKNCRIPEYAPVKYANTLWSDYITNNTSVEDVIEIWDDGANIRSDGQSAPNEGHVGTAVVRDVGRTHTRNYIEVTGQEAKFDLTIDNIYSVIQQKVDGTQAFRLRSVGGIAYKPSGNTELSVNFIGDNRMGCLHIDNDTTDKISLEGTGSLTVADTDFLTVDSALGHSFSSDFGDNKGYISNYWASAIGNNTDDGTGEDVFNLYIYSGVIFAGTTKAEDCTAIGAGGNGDGQVFIKGGKVTAVATTAGTAIGGGMGHNSYGGTGEVHISGGNIYAYNFANKWDIPSAAIGGGGSFGAESSSGIVEISGGYIYAYSVLGTAIGGGSSSFRNGGEATITISGGHIVAKSEKSNGIGGGTGGSYTGYNGGNATISISGNPIIRTGSIGGGKTNNPTGKIGSATIDISGGDIQAQFVMAAGASVKPSFTMSNGLIRNSDTEDSDFYHTQNNGGAVYLEDGNVTISGGEIRQCLADKGGAVYIKGSSSTTFKMTGGKITECVSESDGGAVYLEGGNVILEGGRISYNVANSGNGGGICIVGGNLNMPTGGSAEIIENAAFSQNESGGAGGGLYVTSSGSDVKVDIISGTITENSSDRVGGGISVDMTGHDSFSANVTVGSSGSGSSNNPSISDNHTIIMGGGLYAKGAKADITINGGKIADNTIAGYVANPDVANEGGMVTLNGGNVRYVTVTYNNNGSYLGKEVETQTQKIVTATNSIMKAPDPEFEILGYSLNGWNTRPDGKGTPYTDGQTMNLSTDITLYAQWIRD